MKWKKIDKLFKQLVAFKNFFVCLFVVHSMVQVWMVKVNEQKTKNQKMN